MFNYILLVSFCSTILEPIQAFLNAILCVCMCAHICILFLCQYMQPLSALFSQRGKYETHLGRLQKHMCCPLSHGYQWYPACSSHNCKTISQFSPTQIYFWCLLIDVSHDFGTVFSMAFTVHVYEWPFFSSFIFTFSSLLAFCLLSVLFLFSLGMTFATISESSSCLFLFFFFCNVSPFPLLSFFPTLKGVENFCLSLKSFSQLSCYTRCIAYLRSKTALAFYILFHFFCLGWWFCPLLLSPPFCHSDISPLLPE